MKTLTVVLTLIIALLAGTLSSPMSHAMPMQDTVSASLDEPHKAMQHECCDEQTKSPSTKNSCEQESSFCQHCEQHCAGQIGLITVITEFHSHHFSALYERRHMALWQRTERLIRPPKWTVA